MEVYRYLCILTVLTQKFVLNLGQQPTDEYTIDRTYYNSSIGLTDIPTNIPTDTLEVYLGSNRITKIKVNVFSELSECILLYLDNNMISEVEPGAFNGLGNVTSLDLRGNLLTTLKVGMFQGLVALEQLGLIYNNISSIEDNTFANLMKLKYLHLINNRLESLNPGMFNGLESIEELNIAGNYLTSLPQDVFRHLPRPFELGINVNIINNQNPLQCDAALCWLKQEELNGTIKWDYDYNSAPVCANGVNWDTWSCNETDSVDNSDENRPITESTKTTAETTETIVEPVTLEAAEREDTNNNLWQILFIVAVVLVLVTAVIVVICWKRRGMKICTRSSEASTNRNAHESSRNEITNDNLHDGLTNTPITMGTNDEPGYTSLQRESAEYTEVLDSPTIPPSPQHSVGGDLGYMHPQIESSQNNLDSIIGNVAELGNSLTPTQSSPYEEIPESVVCDDDYDDVYDTGYLHPLGQSDVPDVPVSSRLNSE